MELTQSEKAAALVSLLGQEVASQIFIQLNQEEQKKLLRGLLSGVRVEEPKMQEICQEFLDLFHKKATGIGPKQVSRLLALTGFSESRISRICEICEGIPDWILTAHLSTQLDSVVAAVLGIINTQRSAQIFKAFTPERQTSLLIDLSKEKVLDEAALESLEADLEALKTRSSNGRFGHRLGGEARVLELFQALDPDLRSGLLSKLQSRDSSLGQLLENGLLSVERLGQLLPQHLSMVLGQLKDSDIGSFLRGETMTVQKIYLSSLSMRRRDDIECLLSPELKITLKQKAEACERLRQVALRLKEEEKILFPWEEKLVG